MRLARIAFEAPGARLAGIAYEPRGACRETAIVLAHGYTASSGSMDLPASYLCLRGYPCLTFDFRGHKLGGSTGTLTGAADVLADIRAAAAHARARFGLRRVALVGHSMGGLAAVGHAADDDDVGAVVAIAIGARPSSGFETPLGHALHLQRADYVDGIPSRQLLAELDTVALRAREVRAPLLVIAARSDVIVAMEDAHALAALAPYGEVTEVAASHLDAPDRARALLANWLDSRL